MIPVCHRLGSFERHPPAVVISNVAPLIEGGRYALKRLLGEGLAVEADIFKDGHDLIRAVLQFRREGERRWQEAALVEGDNQRWAGRIELGAPGLWQVAVAAWPDIEGTWRRGFGLKVEAAVDVRLETEEGALLLEAAAGRAAERGAAEAATRLQRLAGVLRELGPVQVLELWDDPALQGLLRPFADRRLLTRQEPVMPVLVERPKAAFSAWYEFFPRNAFNDGARHGGFRDCVAYLDHAASMGFDTIYLPPIHPIGRTNRKGKNNTLTPEPEDLGSPWAIGAAEGGHDAILPELGTLEDFRWFLAQAERRGLEVALDFALQCAPDHPWVAEHPDWFVVRPDGSIQYAENPPKKYQDIYPIHFHGPDWENLWKTLADLLLFWCEQGVRAFRVDNPHTKPVAFWEYAIHRVRQQYPETLFLSEAFTRPKMMAMLGKVGFSQSYSYFTWRTTKQELIDYVTELTRTELAEVMRANFWPNTPDILAYELWDAPLAKFRIRAVLAALLCSNWGIYAGYEFGENRSHPPKEEYEDSEKFQLVQRDLDAEGIVPLIRRLNEIRAANPACAEYRNLEFCGNGNDQVLAWCRWDRQGGGKLLVVVNLDAEHSQEDAIDVSVLGVGHGQHFRVRDLLDGREYLWTAGEPVFVRLDPAERVGHVFVLA